MSKCEICGIGQAERKCLLCGKMTCMDEGCVAAYTMGKGPHTDRVICINCA